MRRLLTLAVLGPVLAGPVVALAGCHGITVQLTGPTAASTKGHHRPSSPSTSSAVRAPGPVSAGSGALRLLSEPQAGVSQIYQLINGAKSSIELTMYELRDTTAESDLAAAAKRGVDVRVILDQHLEMSRNTAAYDFLKSHGVRVTWAPSGTTYHQKTLTVDGKTSVVMTLNLVSADYAGTRDFAVIDTSRSDIAAIVATFNADFAHAGITPPDGADLVWSPTNAQAAILAVINAAKHSLSVENEEMGDSAITTALEAAARRGVDVKIVMTAQTSWDQAFSALTAAGAHVRTYRNSAAVLYIHAKAVVADAGGPDEQMFVGSENFSVASLRYNRELGLRTTNGQVIAALATVLGDDYAGAAAFS
jgi:phosphatidylserine/phosphatidylglycerophosphate/cardiolipin synthase-like enzyme